MTDPSDLASLTALDALLQEVSVSRAARRLGLSTPAMSHALNRLRERLGDPLLVRAGRGMVLTPRALALRPAVAQALTAAEGVFAPTAAFNPATWRGDLTLSLTDYALLIFGLDLDADLRVAAPQLTLRVVPNAVDDPIRLREGRTDLCVGIYGDLPPELKVRPLITDRLVCVVREDHPLCARHLTLAHYLDMDHIQIAPRGQPGGYVDEVLAERGLTRRVTRAVPFFQVALAMAARSDAILTVSERLAQALAPEMGLLIHDPPIPLEPHALSMVWHPRHDGDPGHTFLRERLVAVTQAQGALIHPSPRRRLSPGDPTGHGGTQ